MTLFDPFSSYCTHLLIRTLQIIYLYTQEYHFQLILGIWENSPDARELTLWQWVDSKTRTLTLNCLYQFSLFRLSKEQERTHWQILLLHEPSEMEHKHSDIVYLFYFTGQDVKFSMSVKQIMCGYLNRNTGGWDGDGCEVRQNFSEKEINCNFDELLVWQVWSIAYTNDHWWHWRFVCRLWPLLDWLKSYEIEKDGDAFS